MYSTMIIYVISEEDLLEPSSASLTFSHSSFCVCSVKVNNYYKNILGLIGIKKRLPIKLKLRIDM